MAQVSRFLHSYSMVLVVADGITIGTNFEDEAEIVNLQTSSSEAGWPTPYHEKVLRVPCPRLHWRQGFAVFARSRYLFACADRSRGNRR